MTAQRLDRVLTAYRIGDAFGQFQIFDATGSRLYPGRWNAAEGPMIYASEHYSTAMLEVLANGRGRLPPNQHYIEITVPNGLPYEIVDEATVPGWDDVTCTASRAFGAQWHRERRSVLLIVPSVVARVEQNFLLNPDHPEFHRITCGLHRPVWWDRRLFT